MKTPTSQSLEKALSLLKTITRNKGTVTLADMAEELGLPFSTAHRLARSLEDQGFIVREKRGRYHLGPIVAELAQSVDHQDIMVRVCRPLLKKLARDCRQTVNLGVLENDMVTYLARESSVRKRILISEGMQLEAYCSGIGKVLLAHLPVSVQERYLAEGPFVKLTENTLVDAEALREAFAAIRKHGFATDDAEIFEDVKCIAVPVFSSSGDIKAAISVTGTVEDFAPDRFNATLQKARACAATATKRLYAQGQNP